MKKMLYLIVALLLISSLSMAQLTQGKMAITTDIGPGGAIGGAYALSENMRLDAGINFNSFSPAGGGNSTTTFGIGAGLKLYNPVMENISMFYGGGVMFGSSSTSGTSSSTFGVSVIAGAEYWFSSRFAWGGYCSLGFSSSGSSGATSSNFGTQGVGTSLTWWFN